MFRLRVTKLIRRIVLLLFGRIESQRVWSVIGKMSCYLFTTQELRELMKHLKVKGCHSLDHEPKKTLGAMLLVYQAIYSNPQCQSHTRKEARERYVEVAQTVEYLNVTGEITPFQMRNIIEMLTNPLEVQG